MKKRYLLLMTTTALFAGNAIAWTTTSCPAGVVACGDDCGENCSWELDNQDNIRIFTTNPQNTGTIGSFDCCVMNLAPWVDYYDTAHPNNYIGNGDEGYFNNVKIESGITNLGSIAFPSVRNIEIPDTVTSIGAENFNGAASLTQITIPDTVTSIGPNAFIGDSNLSSVVIEGTPTINNKAFQYMGENTVIYCITGYTECEGKGANVSYYQKQNGKYVLSDGTVIGTYPYKEPKRIYTIEEAQARVKEIGKDHVTFRIRYK